MVPGRLPGSKRTNGRSCIAAYDSPYCSDFFSTDTAESAFQSFLVIYACLHLPFLSFLAISCGLTIVQPQLSGQLNSPFDCTVLVFSTVRTQEVQSPSFSKFL